MRAIFCEKTLDISLIVSREESKGLKRRKEATPFLEADDKGLTFALLNTDATPQLDVREPRDPQAFPRYTIRIGDAAYEALLRDKRVGDRYAGASKVNVIIDDELA